MAHAESNRRDGRPEDIAAADDGAGTDENTVLAGPSIPGETTDGTTGPGLHAGPAEPELAHEPAGAGAGGLSGVSTLSAAQEADAGPADADERDRLAARWQEIQAGFVDDPRRAVQDADALIADMMERLSRLLASEREQIESRAGTGDVSTEDLRQGLQRYRSLFQRLLAA